MMSEYVVLLHGIRRSAEIMGKLEAHLTKLGYDVFNETYPSTDHEIEVLAEHVYEQIQKACPDTSKKIHFVTHSMGGIVARIMIDRFDFDNLGRVVMIAPPNKGSEVVDFLQRYTIFHKMFGPAGKQLGTCERSIVHQLRDADFELGIIAGDKTLDPWFSWFILPGVGDGKVTIESTKMAGMKDHIILPSSHPRLPQKEETLQQVEYFLTHGHFLHR